MAILAALLLQADDLAALSERAQKLEKIPSVEAAAAEGEEIAGKLAELIRSNPEHPKLFQALELLSTVHQSVGRRHLIAGDAKSADASYAEAVRASGSLVERVKEKIAKAGDEENPALQEAALFAGYQFIVASHHRAYALKQDGSRRADLEKLIAELEPFFRDYFNHHDTYFLAVDAAVYFGRCCQFAAESFGDRFSVADRYWTQSLNWLVKGRDLLNLREMREHEDAHTIAARGTLHEIEARLSWSKQLQAAGGPWERQILRAIDAGRSLFAIVPAIGRTDLGQKIASEIQAAEKRLK